jgi:large subunit ribosomal protein L19
MWAVIAKKRTGLSETFTLYRTAYGSSMDRVFMVHSPRIAGIKVIRAGKVRRAKLYYICGKTGKATKIKEQFAGIAATEPPSEPTSPEEPEA